MPQELSPSRVKKLGKAVGYQFKDPALLTLALTHRSVHGSHNYERLEFLGDSILNFLIGEALYEKFSKAKEGQLSRLRAELVKGQTLAEVAKELGVGEYLLLGPGEMKSGGQRRGSILADAVEALLGAIYLESGLDACRERVNTWFSKRLRSLNMEVGKDAKTRLQEYLQSRQLPLPVYEVTSVRGEAHDQTFEVCCRVEGLAVETEGSAASRRKAEQMAAHAFLEQL